MLRQSLKSVSLQCADLSEYSFQIVASLHSVLILREVQTCPAEPCEQKGECRVLKELLLSLLAVLIHGVTYHRVVNLLRLLLFNGCLLPFVVSVRVNDRHEDIQELSLAVVIHLGIKGVEVLGGECLEKGHHRGLLLLVDPLLLEGLEQELVELGHEAEAGAFVKEVELFVVLVIGCCWCNI